MQLAAGAPAHPADPPGRDARHQRVRGHVLRDHRAGADDPDDRAPVVRRPHVRVEVRLEVDLVAVAVVMVPGPDPVE